MAFISVFHPVSARCAQYKNRCFPDGLNKNTTLRGNPYTEDLLRCHTHGYCIWHLWELLSFKQQTDLYDAYFKITGKTNHEHNLLFITRQMRNAAAHGNCLMTNIARPYEAKRKTKRLDTEVISAALKMCGQQMRPSTRGGSLQHQLDLLLLNNFAAVLVCHLRLVQSMAMLEHTRIELNNLSRRMQLHQKEYFGRREGLSAPGNGEHICGFKCTVHIVRRLQQASRAPGEKTRAESGHAMIRTSHHSNE